MSIIYGVVKSDSGEIRWNGEAVRTLFEALRLLAGEGCSILYISHKLDEIMELCDSATILRGGRVTGNVDPRQEGAAPRPKNR